MKKIWIPVAVTAVIAAAAVLVSMNVRKSLKATTDLEPCG